jgi:predicted DNA-binding transcriptional regulator YafY
VADPTGFVLRVSELPRIIEVLSYQGVVPVSAVAAEVGRTEDQVRDVLVRYYVTEDARDRLGLPPPIDFLDDLGEDADPSTATNVRLNDRYVVDDLAFDYAPVEYLARVYRVARDESLLEPDNAVLAGAAEKLRAYLDEDLAPSAVVEGGGLTAAQWYRAARDRHRVRIRYVRAWWPGAAERVVEPYRVVRTRRGWEVDAGPPDEDGRLRTFLLTGVVEAEVLDEEFDPPHDLVDLLVAQRRTTPVRLVVPTSAVWVVERQAERVEVIREDGSDSEVVAHLLEPVADRVARILLVAGPDAFVVTGAEEYQDAGRDLARRLLEHHGG